MPKISELFDENKPGSVKVCRPNWENNWFFQPFFIDANHTWHGLQTAQFSSSYGDEDSSWQIWEKPKPEQEKRFLWLSPERGKLYYLTKLEAETSLNDPIRLTSKMIDEGF